MIKNIDERSVEEFIKTIKSKDMLISKLRIKNDALEYQLKSFKIRLLYIKNRIDYLLQHPYSKDSKYTSFKHEKTQKKEIC